MSKFRTLLLGGAAVAVAGAVLLKRKEIAGLLPSRTGTPAGGGWQPTHAPGPSNYDAPGPVANTATPVPAPEPAVRAEPGGAIDEQAEVEAAAAEAANIGGQVSDYAGVHEPDLPADAEARPLVEAGEGASEGAEQAEHDLAESAEPVEPGRSDAERRIEDTRLQEANPIAPELVEPVAPPADPHPPEPATPAEPAAAAPAAEPAQAEPVAPEPAAAAAPAEEPVSPPEATPTAEPVIPPEAVATTEPLSPPEAAGGDAPAQPAEPASPAAWAESVRAAAQPAQPAPTPEPAAPEPPKEADEWATFSGLAVPSPSQTSFDEPLVDEEPEEPAAEETPGVPPTEPGPAATRAPAEERQETPGTPPTSPPEEKPLPDKDDEDGNEWQTWSGRAIKP